MSTETELVINERLRVPLTEIDWHAIRAQGAGGQHVNKTSSAVHLRFDVRRSSLPRWARERIVGFADHHIGRDGVIVIKSQSSRSQLFNREAALERLRELLLRALKTEKPRRATRPSRGAKERRLKAKAERGQVKRGRGRVRFDD
ncbi:MAG: alternative ribosome rescue aminoacyl-tRNA hydrolase ArfB [Pseudomonadota bacterium]